MKKWILFGDKIKKKSKIKRFTKEEKTEMFDMLQEGYTYQEIAREYDTSAGAIGKIVLKMKATTTSDEFEQKKQELKLALLEKENLLKQKEIDLKIQEIEADMGVYDNNEDIPSWAAPIIAPLMEKMLNPKPPTKEKPVKVMVEDTEVLDKLTTAQMDAVINKIPQKYLDDIKSGKITKVKGLEIAKGMFPDILDTQYNQIYEYYMKNVCM